MKYLISLIFCLSYLYGCGNDDLMRQINNYRGDGTIKFLDAPGPLGRAGVSISFPPFNLSNDFSKSYDLTGIPQGEAYLIYMVINESDSSNTLFAAACSYKLTKDGNSVSNKSSRIKDMAKAVGKGDAQYYFYDKNEGPDYFAIDDSNAKWALSVSYESSNELNSGKAFYVLKTGGSK